jgi:ATP-dependent helicase/nuclease subunit B
MSLQFVIGNSGSGKTEYVYRQVIRDSAESPDRQFLVIVPEQFTMQTQKDIVSRHDDHGIRNIDVLSFARLAWRIFEELGTQTGIVLDDMGKNLILRKIAAEYEGKLKVLKGNLRKPGYISEVKSVISEFKQYDIGMDEMEQMLGAEGEGSYLYWKLRDIRMVYEGFEEYLGETYVTGEELLEIFAGVIKKSRILQDSVVVLDGFTGFTPVQRMVIRELLKVCRKVLVTVTIDIREDIHQNFEDYQLFALSKKTVQSVEQLARNVRATIEQPILMTPYSENPELGFLEQQIFRRSKKSWDQPCTRVHLYQADDPEQEVRFLAGMIRRMVRTKEMYYRDIAVITGELPAYQNYVRRIFPEYGIPYFMDESRNILMNNFVEYIRSLLALAEQDFSYESVFRFLRSGYGIFTEDEIDELENYVLATGIRGYKRWQQPMLRLTRDADEEDLQRINHYRVQFVECVKDLMFVLKKRDKTVRDITEALHTFFLQEELQQKLKAQEEKFRQNGKEALALEYAQVYRCVIELFDRFVALLGDEPISLREYSELLDAGLQEARIGIVPPGIDQIVLGDVERTRLANIRCLFFLGVNDCYIPGNGQTGGLLTDEDKEAFARNGLTLSPTQKEKLFIQKFYLYQMLTKPSEQLYLSWARTDADGKSLRPSYLVQELQKLFPKLTVEKADAHTGDMTEEIGFSEMVRSIFRGELTDGEVSDENAKTDSRERMIKGQRIRTRLLWYMQQDEWKKQLLLMLDEQQKKKQRYIEEKLADRLYSADGKFGATELENYASCAYAHFLGYGLHLSEREEYTFRAMDWGNIFHRAIERYAKKLRTEERTWQETDGEIREQYVEDALRDSIADYGNSVLYSSSRNEYLITRMQRILSRTIWALTEQLKKGEFYPSGYEVPISHGKIDRVDLCEDEEHVYVKVVDYKTGNRSLNLNDVYYGLQMQLVLYLQAAVDQTRKEKRGKIVIPAGVFYYRIQDPILETEETETDKLENERLSVLCPTGLVNNDPDVLKKLDAELVPPGSSTVIPISLNKNGSVSARSRASISLKDMTTTMDYTQGKKEELQVEILDGIIAQEPYRKDKETACDYCPYTKICSFEGARSGAAYRDLKQMEREEILQKMREEEADGSDMDE